MGPFFCFFKFETGSPNHYFHPKIDELSNQHLQVHLNGSTLTDGNIIDTITGLQLSKLIQLIDDNLGNSVALQIQNYPGSLAHVTFIVHMGNSLNYFIIYQLTNSIGEHITIYLIRHLCNYNLLPAALFGIYMASAPHYHPSSSGTESLFDAFHAKNNTPGRKIRCFDNLHQLIYCNIPILNKCNTSIHRFTQIVRHHISSHPHRNSGRTIYQ